MGNCKLNVGLLRKVGESYKLNYEIMCSHLKCHFMVIVSFCVIKLYYLDNYLGVVESYHGKMFYNIGTMRQT
jgi:hypothetical protein